MEEIMSDINLNKSNALLLVSFFLFLKAMYHFTVFFAANLVSVVIYIIEFFINFFIALFRKD